MRSFVTIIFLCCLLPPAYSEIIEEWGLNYSSELSCRANSDLCSRTITLDDGIGASTKMVLVGPVKLAIANRQIISCESNSVVGTQEAKIFDLAGDLIAVVSHRGFMRNCGITTDGALYWFHYNKVKSSVPINILVVVTNMGRVVYEETHSAGGDIEFLHNGKGYVVSIQPPELPG